VTVLKLLNDSVVAKQEVIPQFRQAVDNKMISWRLRFAVAEVAA
jgi:hypothetical protein